MKDINSKLKNLKLQLYKDSNPDKKSACFWCTYEFDNPVVTFKYEMKKIHQVMALFVDQNVLHI